MNNEYRLSIKELRFKKFHFKSRVQFMANQKPVTEKSGFAESGRGLRVRRRQSLFLNLNVFFLTGSLILQVHP